LTGKADALILRIARWAMSGGQSYPQEADRWLAARRGGGRRASSYAAGWTSLGNDPRSRVLSFPHVGGFGPWRSAPRGAPASCHAANGNERRHHYPV